MSKFTGSATGQAIPLPKYVFLIIFSKTQHFSFLFSNEIIKNSRKIVLQYPSIISLFHHHHSIFFMRSFDDSEFIPFWRWAKIDLNKQTTVGMAWWLLSSVHHNKHDHRLRNAQNETHNTRNFISKYPTFILISSIASNPPWGKSTEPILKWPSWDPWQSPTI